jgi:phosphate transport system substrate-binding protein
MSLRAVASFVASAVLLLGTASGCRPADPEKVTLTGSSTIAPLAAELGKRFEKANPGVRIDVQTGGSSRGIADAKRGLADIGMSSRALKDDEKEGLSSVVLALDGVCFLVHKDNPVNELNNAQIVEIFTGKTANWKAVGGKDAPITVINRADGRSELELFTHHFKLKASDIKASLIAGDNEQGIKTLAGNPDAIIYMSIGTSEQDAARGVPIKLLPLAGVQASVENVRNGSFPFSRPLVLITGKTVKPTAQKFLDFALSAEAQPLIQEFSFVPKK